MRASSASQRSRHLDRACKAGRSPEFLGAVADLCRERKQTDAAIQVWQRVLGLNPSSKTARENLAKLLLLKKQNSAAIAHLQAWAELEPGSAVAHALLGTTLLSLQRWEDARQALRKSLAISPDQTDILAAAAGASWRLGLIPDAISYLQQVLSLDPANTAALNDIGVMNLQTRRPREAAAAFAAAIKLAPDTPTIQYNLSVALRQLGQVEPALSHARKAVSLGNPTEAMVTNLGALLNDSDRFDDALAALAQVNLFGSPNTLKVFSRALRGLKRHDEAASALRTGLETHPHDSGLWFYLANVLSEQGLLADAEDALDKAIELAPAVGAPHRAKADIHKYAQGDSHLAQMEALLETADPSSEDYVEFQFALAKAFDDLHEYGPAFEHMMLGNRAKRAASPYDEAGVERLSELVRSLFPEPIAAGNQAQENSSKLPVFVVGMPRSGTTLVEQMLASHPQVVGMGETPDFQRELDTVIFCSSRPQERPVAVEEVAELGKRYLERISPKATGADRAIDKLPSNFFFLGFIASALPNAQIIHVRRNSVDTCISLYSKLFTKTQNFSYDLAELGRYYRHYEQIMEHWRKVLPPGCLLEVEYEAVVEDPEAEARRMLAFLDLPWDEACLRPHASASIVLTASAAQVRQPIYKSSVGRREGYLPYLRPLLEQLGGG